MAHPNYTTRNFLLLMTVAVAVFIIFEFIVINQIALAILVLIGLLIPLGILAFQYHRSVREFQCNNCQQVFTVSQLKLVFTVKFGGTDPPTGTVAYDLKCPHCHTRYWLIPTG